MYIPMAPALTTEHWLHIIDVSEVLLVHYRHITICTDLGIACSLGRLLRFCPVSFLLFAEVVHISLSIASLLCYYGNSIATNNC